MAEEGFEMVRYADDFVILCESQKEAERALELVQNWTDSNGLRLHPDKTKLVDAHSEEGFTFLGYHFHEGRKEPRDKAKRKFKDEIRTRTKKTNGQSLETIIAEVNEVARGWYEYFKHSLPSSLRHMDQFIRQRLRAIERKRQGLSGPVNKKDNVRWPNAYFANRGLFSMEAARFTAKQSLV